MNTTSALAFDYKYSK